jgi:hypothetical protein
MIVSGSFQGRPVTLRLALETVVGPTELSGVVRKIRDAFQDRPLGMPGWPQGPGGPQFPTDRTLTIVLALLDPGAVVLPGGD